MMKIYRLSGINRLMLISIIILLVGCKGKKGDTGSSGIIATKTYTGTPTTNPYYVGCPEITDITKVLVRVFMTRNYSEIKELPVTIGYISHSYEIIDTTIKITSRTYYGSLTSVALQDNIGSYPQQWDYRIDIRTFTGAPAKSIYLQANEIDQTFYNRLIYGNQID